jgi:putative component of toxin-antitoxin plasmid stabilization module
MIAPWILGERIVLGSLGCTSQTGEGRFELRCNPPSGLHLRVSYSKKSLLECNLIGLLYIPHDDLIRNKLETSKGVELS